MNEDVQSILIKEINADPDDSSYTAFEHNNEASVKAISGEDLFNLLKRAKRGLTEPLWNRWQENVEGCCPLDASLQEEQEKWDNIKDKAQKIFEEMGEDFPGVIR